MRRPGTTPTRGPEQSDDWRRHGSCRFNPDLFFPDGDTGPWKLVIAEAKQVCETQCPVLDECLIATLRHERGLGANSRFGIAGGLDRHERAALDATPRRVNQNT